MNPVKAFLPTLIILTTYQNHSIADISKTKKGFRNNTLVNIQQMAKLEGNSGKLLDLAISPDKMTHDFKVTIHEENSFVDFKSFDSCLLSVPFEELAWQPVNGSGSNS